MSAPFTGAPQFIFNTPTEEPLSDGGRWNSIINLLRRPSSGVITNYPGPIAGEMLYNPVFWEDAAVCVEFVNNPTSYSLYMKLRSSSDGITSFYEFFFTGPAGTWVIYKKLASGSITTVTSGAGPDLRALDRIGVSAIGSTLKMWYLARIESPLGVSPLNSTAWTEVLSTTDTGLTSGYFTLGINSAEGEITGGFGGAVFPVGGGTGTTFGPGSPTFNVQIRTVTTP